MKWLGFHCAKREPSSSSLSSFRSRYCANTAKVYELMKRLLIYLLLMVCYAQLHAVPAHPRPAEVKQKDGTTLKVVQVGDEYAHCYATLDGVPLIKCADNSYYYAIVGGSNELKPSTWLAHTQTQRSVSEQAFVNQHTFAAQQVVKQTWVTQNRMANQRRCKVSESKRVLGRPTNYKGYKKGLVILVNFADVKMHATTAHTDFDMMFNQVGYAYNQAIGSVHDYFYCQSYGQFNLAFDVVGPITLSKSYSYYGANSSTGNDLHADEMVVEACHLVANQVNFADYDWDNDGEVDQVYLIYAGYGENYSGADPNTIWPHESRLEYTNNRIVLNGTGINVYACSAELTGTKMNAKVCYNGIGVACHEFSHCLGLPDFYDTSKGGGKGMLGWDLMASGSYSGPTGNGEVPTGYSAYERSFVGWLTLKEINTPTIIKDMPALNDEPVAYVLYNDAHRQEYFVLENRQARGWFSYVDQTTDCHGLLITHVDYADLAWQGNRVNAQSTHQRMSVVMAVGGDDDRKYTFPGEGDVTAFTSSTHAKCGGRLFNANMDGNYNFNKPVTHIREDDGLLSFYVMGGRLLDTPHLLPAQSVTKNGFTICWQPVSEAEVYDVEVTDVHKASQPNRHLLLCEKFNFFRSGSDTLGVFTDLSADVNKYMGCWGWDAKLLFATSTGIKLGTTTVAGSLTTPQLMPNDTCVTLCLTAAAIGKTGATLTVSTQVNNAPVAIVNQALTTEHQRIMIHLCCEALQKMRVNITSNQPVLIDSLALYDGYFTTIDLDDSVADGSKAIVLYTNIADTTLVLSQLTGTAYAYRVRAYGGDFVSPWSNYQYATLTSASLAINEVFANDANSVVYYTLSGKRVTHLRIPGIYLMCKGNKVTKVIVSAH